MPTGSGSAPLQVSAPSAAFNLDGNIPPRRIPAAYRLTLGLSAFALVLLPLAYVGLIVVAGWGAWLYAIHAKVLLFGEGGGFFRIILYGGPLVAAVILIIFMVKPLFARRPVSVELLELDMDQEPVLRDLIQGICERVRAPMPTVVNVDCMVNASARLRQGWLSLGQRDLALTIGLPLAANLSARQLAGVLAHEFGHFAQGGGMALTYVIRSINGWFARVVFERDEWDDQLDEWSQKGDFRIALILQLARGAVWMSRRILHGLMYVGHAVTCLQLRQMEYDADYYETYVSGSSDFAHTSRELARLGPTMLAVLNELGGLWEQRRLVNDLPGLVMLRRSQLTADSIEQITAIQMESRTRWLDTHPSDRDRIAHAERLALPGLFRGEGPASRLFRDFPGLCVETTRYHYGKILDLSIKEENLVPIASVALAGEEANAIESARQRLAGQLLNLNRPLIWSETDFLTSSEPQEPDVVARQLVAARAELARLRPAAETVAPVYAGLFEDLENARYARAFLRDGIQIKPEAFRLVTSDLAVAERRISEVETQIAHRIRDLAAFEAAVHGWIALVVKTARARTLQAQLSPERVAHVERMAATLVALKPLLLAFPGWLHTHTVFTLYVGNAQSMGSNYSFFGALDRQRQHVRSFPKLAREMLGEFPHPFPDSDQVPTITAALDKALVGIDLDGRPVVLIRLVANLYFRILGHLALSGEQFEQILALQSSEPATCPPLLPTTLPSPAPMG